MDAPDPHRLSDRFARIAPAVNANAHLVHRGRTLTGVLLVEIGDMPHLLHLDAGRIAAMERRLALFQDRLLTIRGSARAWHALWQPLPEPGWHDLFALTQRGEMRIEGCMHSFFAHLQYLKDVLEMPRHPPLHLSASTQEGQP